MVTGFSGAKRQIDLGLLLALVSPIATCADQRVSGGGGRGDDSSPAVERELRLTGGLSARARSLGGCWVADGVGPVTGGNGVPVRARRPRPRFDLASVGYQQSEYFVEGTATPTPRPHRSPRDGKWTVAPSSQAAYKTRIVVNRPVKRRTSTAP